jgi:ComEC/Rec2-related protein
MQALEKERHNFWLWIPALFAFGCIFFISFQENFLTSLVIFSALFFAAIFLSICNRSSNRFLICAAIAIFLTGSFYAFFYQKTFLSHTEITGKVYVDGVGKIESLRKFHNPINHLDGANLVIAKPVLYKSEFTKKKEHPTVKKKKSSPKKISKSKLEKNFINLQDYQDLDRGFLDHSKNYQQVEWIGEKKLFPNPPAKISLNLVRFDESLSLNDEIAFKALLEPAEDREFPNDFDYKLDAKAKKIGASGFVIGKIEITKKAEISSIDGYFSQLRETIRNKINQHLSGDEAAISIALLIGDQKVISKDLLEKIRISGLAHLLSISGFHLSLAGAIFFIKIRFCLSRSEYLALNFDIKKIAGVAAIIATYFYLKIAGSPIPAQRAFLMIFLVFLALIFHEKINAKRAIMASALILILYNPYVIFNIGFQLSFVAVLVLATFYNEFKYQISPKILRYFCEIILLSIIIQIISLPFILHSFGNVAWLGFISNILAIPLSSFFIMPLGFLALFLMPLNLEKYALLAMEKGIFLLEKIINFVNEIAYANFASPHLSNLGLIIATAGILLILFHKNHLRCYGIILFLLSFCELQVAKKPDLIFEKEQKFFAIYDEKNGVLFSKKLRESRQCKSWMKRFGEDEFKVGNFCEKNKCEFEQKGRKILVVLKRSKISELCEKEFDLVVNLTAKYELPECVKAKKKIDNFDFYLGGTKEVVWRDL